MREFRMNETSRYWLSGTGVMKAAAIALAVYLSPLDMAGCRDQR